MAGPAAQLGPLIYLTSAVLRSAPSRHSLSLASTASRAARSASTARVAAAAAAAAAEATAS